MVEGMQRHKDLCKADTRLALLIGEELSKAETKPAKAASTAEEAPKPQSAMPTLPARPASRPAGMPTLPARPTKSPPGSASNFLLLSTGLIVISLVLVTTKQLQAALQAAGCNCQT